MKVFEETLPHSEVSPRHDRVLVLRGIAIARRAADSVAHHVAASVPLGRTLVLLDRASALPDRASALLAVAFPVAGSIVLEADSAVATVLAEVAASTAVAVDSMVAAVAVVK